MDARDLKILDPVSGADASGFKSLLDAFEAESDDERRPRVQ